MSRSWPRALLGAVCLLALACSEEKRCPKREPNPGVPCTSSADCATAGHAALSCVGGSCRLGCAVDTDCFFPEISTQERDACKDEITQAPQMICQENVCAVPSCPTTPCAAGEACTDGRCVVWAESFEKRGSAELVTLGEIGWNDLSAAAGTPKENRSTKLASDVPGCPPTGDERCAGPAAHGTRFVLIGRDPTPARPVPATNLTCRACACCRACRQNPPAVAPSLATCPARDPVEGPAEPLCPSTPAVCQAVCGQCDACPAAPPNPPPSPALPPCELQAASKACINCLPTTQGGPCPPPVNGMPQPCPGCSACQEAANCDATEDLSARCNEFRRVCMTQGEQGCFATPYDYPRSVLTEEEQATMSPTIDLSGQTGRLVLEFSALAYNLPEQYRQVVQSAPSSTWPTVPVELVLQLCPGRCEQPGSWTDAQLLGGGRAALPPPGEQNNGLSLGSQSKVDWARGRLAAEIPESARTAGFRFRFLPRMRDGSRAAIDHLIIRRLP